MTKSPRKKLPSRKKPARKKRKPRTRTTPKTLLEAKSDEYEMGKRRCLMILSVLSGDKSVTEAIEEAKIPRPTYYHLESKALDAMLHALSPQGDGHKTEMERMTHQLQELEDKLAQLQKDKRRYERLLLLTRKVVKAGPMTTGKRRRRRKKSSSTPKAATTPANSETPPLTRTKASAVAP